MAEVTREFAKKQLKAMEEVMKEHPEFVQSTITRKHVKAFIEIANSIMDLEERANMVYTFGKALFSEGFYKPNLQKLYDYTKIPKELRIELKRQPLWVGGEDGIGGNEVAFLPVDYPTSTRIDIVNFPTGFQHPKRKTKYKPLFMYMDMNKKLVAVVNDKEGEVFHISESNFRISKRKS